MAICSAVAVVFLCAGVERGLRKIVDLTYVKRVSQLPKGVRDGLVLLERAIIKSPNLKVKTKRFQVESGERYMLQVVQLGNETVWNVNGKTLDKS